MMRLATVLLLLAACGVNSCAGFAYVGGGATSATVGAAGAKVYSEFPSDSPSSLRARERAKALATAGTIMFAYGVALLLLVPLQFIAAILTLIRRGANALMWIGTLGLGLDIVGAFLYGARTSYLPGTLASVAIIALGWQWQRTAATGSLAGAAQPMSSASMPPATYACARCGAPLVFVAEYQRWFCTRCQQYV